MVPRRYEQNLCQCCGKVATKRVFSLYFNVKFMTSQRRQFPSDFVELHLFSRECLYGNIRTKFMHVHSLFTKHWRKKKLPSKIDQNQYFFLFSPVRNKKTLIVRKIIFMPKWPQYSFHRLARTTRSKNFAFLKKIGKTSRGVVTTPPPLSTLKG